MHAYIVYEYDYARDIMYGYISASFVNAIVCVAYSKVVCCTRLAI